ncbi:MAG: LEVG family PEP-CTERM protein [Leptolyngbyaceae cyanobacterium]
MHLTKKLMTRVGFAVPMLAASMTMTAAMTADAQAFDLVPQQEGEIALDNKACITGNCIQLNPIVESVESLEDASTGTQSSLFVDKYNTRNNYGAFSFRKKDVGTADTDGAYWFRPVAFNTDGSAIEGGELEVGLKGDNLATALAA